MTNTPQNQIIIYESEDGRSNVEVRFEGETVWLTQAQLVDLFQSSKDNISEHIKNIYDENELGVASTVRKFRILYQTDKLSQINCVFRCSEFPNIWATGEYRKYKAKNLSEVEKHYLETIKTVEKKIKKKLKQ